jgi:hypothetical protein
MGFDAELVGDGFCADVLNGLNTGSSLTPLLAAFGEELPKTQVSIL